MPFILLTEIIVIMLLEPLMPLELKSMIYGISLIIKSLIIFLLPFLIFGLLFKVATNLAHKATKIIALVLASVCLSNFISTFISYFVGSLVYHIDLSLIVPKDLTKLEPAWTFLLPKIIANDKAMFLGLVLGVIVSLLKPDLAAKTSQRLEKIVGKILSSFATLIPLFVAGFVVKLQHEGILIRIVQDYALIFAVVALAQFTYIIFLYFAINQFNIKKSLKCVQNMLPAALAGFSTMSSVAAMPLTILATEKHSDDPDLARSIIPATVNIHLIGDCFAIPIFAFAVLKNFGVEDPTFFSYLTFAFYFVLAKFSVSAIPGGGILVMLPILESHLGFNAEMLSLITALYILFDPVITSANVLGNGSFSIIICKLNSLLRINKIKSMNI
ncbi:MAG TPA: cation:dicarboxylase symporter family transporter [Alphaproteobacteria bacterium]|nr:cation:dicarboxylase symporter family transporter [Alphaproteobacteria bacterium]